MYKCEKCGKEFNTKRGLTTHSLFHNEEYLKKRSEITKNQWKDEKFRKIHTEKMKRINKEIWSNEEFVNKQREYLRELGKKMHKENPNRMREMLKLARPKYQQWLDSGGREYLSEIKKKYNSEHKEDIRRWVSESWTPEKRAIQSERMRQLSNKLWKDPAYIEMQKNLAKKRLKDGSEFKKIFTGGYTDEKWVNILSGLTDEWTYEGKSERKGSYIYIKHKCGEVKEVQTTHLYDNGLSCRKCDPFGSKDELVLRDFLSKYVNIDKKYRGEFLYELDMLSGNIAFEYNGSYWHCVRNNNLYKNYHKNKMDYFLSKGIKVYYLWDYWGLDKCKALAMSKLGIYTNRIYARNLELKEVSYKDQEEFFDKYHVQNNTKAFAAYGLYQGDELIECMSIRNNGEFIEIARLATKSGYQVVGGFTRLLKKIKEYNKDILSYALRDLCPDYHDSVYYKNGFTFIHDSGPTLKYYEHNKNKVVDRQKYQKYKLKTLFPDSYLDSKTANEILAENNIYPIWDSGNFKFVLRVN